MMMDSVIISALNIIKESLWGTDPVQPLDIADAESVYILLQKHAIYAIPAEVIKHIDIPEYLREKWKRQILGQIFQYATIVNAQNEVLSALEKEGIPIIVLKGTAAAQYYPVPQYRVMGDIDLLVKKEDFYRAVKAIIAQNYATSESEHDIDRHISFSKGNVMIELHWRFASENVISNPSEFDDILYADIKCGCTVLSDSQNGLVLLEHIAQHLNNGIGLRQIIDWMMYVNQCLDDDLWDREFRILAEKTGLDKLAIHVTRMCQIYLGLKEENITWCMGADETSCENLLEYIINCGNFGRARESWESGEITKIPSPRHPIRLLKYLQERGKKGWTLCRKYPALKSVAWAYQLNRYIRIAKESKAKGITVKETYDKGSMRRDMFNKLGIRIKTQ